VSGTRQAILLGAIPVFVGIFYLVLQVGLGDGTVWVLPDGNIFDAAGALVAKVTGTMDPAGVILLVSLGLAMGFGFLVILRGARDL
jgi:hypothetical protein